MSDQSAEDTAAGLMTVQATSSEHGMKIEPNSPIAEVSQESMDESEAVGKSTGGTDGSSLVSCSSSRAALPSCLRKRPRLQEDERQLKKQKSDVSLSFSTEDPTVFSVPSADECDRKSVEFDLYFCDVCLHVIAAGIQGFEPYATCCLAEGNTSDPEKVISSSQVCNGFDVCWQCLQDYALEVRLVDGNMMKGECGDANPKDNQDYTISSSYSNTDDSERKAQMASSVTSNELLEHRLLQYRHFYRESLVQGDDLELTGTGQNGKGNNNPGSHPEDKQVPLRQLVVRIPQHIHTLRVVDRQTEVQWCNET